MTRFQIVIVIIIVAFLISGCVAYQDAGDCKGLQSCQFAECMFNITGGTYYGQKTEICLLKDINEQIRLK